MITSTWLKKRQPCWQRLEELLAQIQRDGLASLDRKELREAGLLYRQTATDLATVRGDASSRQQAYYLNQLLGRAHNIIYSGQKASISRIVSFYLHEYPQIFRRLLPYTAAATIIFILGGLLGMTIALSHPAFMRSFLGYTMMESIEHHEMWTKSIVGIAPQSSSSIATNNLSVSFSAYAMGITAGTGTIYMILYNGLLMGVVGAACWLHGMSLSLWSFVAPHGALELPAIFIAGGAGLRLACGMLFPGALPRREALARGGLEATQLVVGIIPMLLIAGAFEGFFSPSSAPIALKFAVSAFLFTLLNFYLWQGGRGKSADKAKNLPFV